jgi:peptidyl-tRNA hydrolase, PTH1 family
VKLVVGLGNPGKKYAGTRHNVGFDVLDRLAGRHQVEWESAPRGIDALSGRWRASDAVLAKPLTFVNLSGHAMSALLQFYKIDASEAIVVVDDINLELGRLRARAAGSAGGHNGLKSIIEGLGTDQFPRLRVGVGRGDPRRDLADHVLARVPMDLKETLATAVDAAASAAELFVTDGIEEVMNRFNRRLQTADDADVDADKPGAI